MRNNRKTLFATVCGLMCLLMVTGESAAVAPTHRPAATIASTATTAMPATDRLGKACLPTDAFTGSTAAMVHFLNCKQIPYDSYCNGCTVPQQHDADGNLITTGAVTRDATGPNGGPPCQWLAYHVAEYCYGHGVPHLMCIKWWYDNPQAYYCKPVEAYALINDSGLRNWAFNNFDHAAKACLVDADIAGIVAVIVILATGGTGYLAAVGVGCVGGALTYWFKP